MSGGWQVMQQANAAARLHKEMSEWCIDTERKAVETFEETVNTIIFSILAYVDLKKDDNRNARTFNDVAACMNSRDQTRKELALMCSCFILMFIFERNRLQGITCTNISMAEHVAKKCARLSGMSENTYFAVSAGKMITFKDFFEKMWRKRKDWHQKHLRETVQEYAVVTKPKNVVAIAHSMLRRDKATFFLHKNKNRKLGVFVRVLDYRLNDEWNKLLRGVNRDWTEDGLPIDVKFLHPPAPIAELQLRRSPVSDIISLTGHYSSTLEARMAVGHLAPTVPDGQEEGGYAPSSPQPIYCTKEPGDERGGSLVTATTCPATEDQRVDNEEYPSTTTDMLMQVGMQEEEAREAVREVLDCIVIRVSETVASAEENKGIQISSGAEESGKLLGGAVVGEMTTLVEPAQKMSTFSFAECYREVASTSCNSISTKSAEEEPNEVVQGDKAVTKRKQKAHPQETLLQEPGTVTKRRKKGSADSSDLLGVAEAQAAKVPKRKETVVPADDTREDDGATASTKEITKNVRRYVVGALKGVERKNQRSYIKPTKKGEPARMTEGQLCWEVQCDAVLTDPGIGKDVQGFVFFWDERTGEEATCWKCLARLQEEAQCGKGGRGILRRISRNK